MRKNENEHPKIRLRQPIRGRRSEGGRFGGSRGHASAQKGRTDFSDERPLHSVNEQGLQSADQL